MLLTAYYFRQHMYTLVPRHLREDLAWMADAGTRAVAIGVLEQDLEHSRANLDIICREAERAGMAIWAVPSRWGGIIAGSLKVPSLFTSIHPETWILRENGTPVSNHVWGPMSSVHHPATFAFYAAALEKLLHWPFAGIVWDEPKILHVWDRSPAGLAALERCRARDGFDESHWPADSLADFLDRAGHHARTIRLDLKISLFMYASIDGYPIERCARMAALDYLGCDGRPWSLADDAPDGADERTKTLIDQGPRFLAAARAAGKGGLFLVENHNMDSGCLELMDRRLPDVLAMAPEQLIYYYYPRNVPDPDRAMGILRRHLKAAAPQAARA